MSPTAWWTVFGVATVALVGAGLYEAHKAGAAQVPAGPLNTPNAPTPTYGGKPAAAALAAALASGGCSAPNLTTLATAFQQANNADAGAVARTGTLPTSGQFDQSTAAALAWYGYPATPPCPSTAATPAATAGNPGPAASTAYLLSDYLTKNGCDGSATLTTLCQNFQTANNTDTSGLGPTSAQPLTATLTTAGTFDSATSQALALYTGTAAMTPCG